MRLFLKGLQRIIICERSSMCILHHARVHDEKDERRDVVDWKKTREV